MYPVLTQSASGINMYLEYTQRDQEFYLIPCASIESLCHGPWNHSEYLDKTIVFIGAGIFLHLEPSCKLRTKSSKSMQNSIL